MESPAGKRPLNKGDVGILSDSGFGCTNSFCFGFRIFLFPAPVSNFGFSCFLFLFRISNFPISCSCFGFKTLWFVICLKFKICNLFGIFKRLLLQYKSHRSIINQFYLHVCTENPGLHFADLLAQTVNKIGIELIAFFRICCTGKIRSSPLVTVS